MALLALPYYPSRSREYQRIWGRLHSANTRYWKHRDYNHKLIYARNYYNLNKKEQREKTKQRALNLKLTLFSMFGSRCVKCGFTDHRALQLDHIKGSGAEMRRYTNLHKSRVKYYQWLLNNPEYTLNEIQLLCANCNWIKRFENNEVS